MKVVHRLPIYTTGIALMGALVLLADAYDWSGWTIALVGLATAAFYVLGVLAPWLVYEQLARASVTVTGRHSSGNGHTHTVTVEMILQRAGGAPVVLQPERPTVGASPVAVAEPSLVTASR